MPERSDNHRDFDVKPSLQLEKFGFREDFIKSLSPEDLRDATSGVSKALLKRRHSDKAGENTDYQVGHTDVRELTAFAGRLSRMSDEEVAILQNSYSTDEVLDTYRREASDLAQMLEFEQAKTRVLGSRALELLLANEKGETLNGFIGELYCRLDVLTGPKLGMISVAEGGKVAQVREVKPVAKKYLSDAENWAQDAYRIAKQARPDTKKPFFLVPTSMGIKVRIGEDLVGIDELGIEQPEFDPKTQAQELGKIYAITDSIKKDDGASGEPLFVTFSKQGKRLNIPPSSVILGFLDWDVYSNPTFDTPTTHEISPHYALNAEPVDDKGINSSTNLAEITVGQFWARATAKGGFSRSLVLPSDKSYHPVLYTPGGRGQSCLVLDKYLMGVPR